MFLGIFLYILLAFEKAAAHLPLPSQSILQKQ
jgi:hypothetical protein